MAIRLARPAAALALLAALWGLDSIRMGRPDAAAATAAKPMGGRVRILGFYASTGLLLQGERATLCYGVENAKAVTIAPLMLTVYPSKKYCFAIVPTHTTHYTLMAEGYDGIVDTRTLTVPVHARPPVQSQPLNVAVLVF
ncbi:MAG TPA: hypothetical protein VMU19_09435 [Bryobacteraceae bacterium]|nr:hypothetical protein [Bryobacteraceae bacterium]